MIVAKFKFIMEPILKMRQLREDQESRHTAQRVAQLLRAERDLDTVERRIKGHYANIRSAGLIGRLSVHALMGDRRHLNHLHQVHHTQLTRVAKARKLVDQARRELARAKRDTDTMSKLKERAYERYTKEQRRRETVMLDDIAASTFAWRRQKAS